MNKTNLIVVIFMLVNIFNFHNCAITKRNALSEEDGKLQIKDQGILDKLKNFGSLEDGDQRELIRNVSELLTKNTKISGRAVPIVMNGSASDASKSMQIAMDPEFGNTRVSRNCFFSPMNCHVRVRHPHRSQK